MILSLLTLSSLILFLIFSFFNPNNNKSNITILLLLTSAFMSGCLLLGWLLANCPVTYFSLSWLSAGLTTFSLSFIVDRAFIIFLAVALFVTWSIIEFSHYYMEADPNKQSFLNTLIFFLLFMLVLVSSNNLFLLFIGWEGVGFCLLFLLDGGLLEQMLNEPALQAVIYNRIGDSGMLLFLLSSIITYNTWNLNEIILLSPISPQTVWGLIGIIVAAAGKSAQFILHPWLPSAMEGPTPVSALLHSSTMVVAGVFFLYRCSPILPLITWIPPLIGVLGSLTALFAASAAIAQYDLKKVVAYSTTSQLGLMVVAIGINIPELALFHICTHAFFKSLLFLSSGSIIHSLNNEQDLRKMSNSLTFLPFTTSCIVIGSVALCGFPFLAGYYSKDLILEAGQANIVNSLSIILSLIATLMTALYSARVVLYLGTNTNTPPLNPISEENNNLYYPLVRLIFGVFVSGWLIYLSIINLPPIIVPLLNKSLPIIVTLYSVIFIFERLTPNPINTNICLGAIKFLSNNWFYVQVVHGNTLSGVITTSVKGVLRSIDQGWAASIGGLGITHFTRYLVTHLQFSQQANIITYLTYSTLIFLMLGILCL
uniref:NADH-ubiquinone oxidoreductase chain 5 n=1 Tax=Ophiocomina nigra TaxID=55617 RepID=D3H5U6_9ECHI|nr:NADH dehydrogenase subunit 5 [Ophiocomina nigra]